MFSIRIFLLSFIAFLEIANASPPTLRSGLHCQDLFDDKTSASEYERKLRREQRVPARPETMTYWNTGHQNASLLREFFGPMKNTFRDWLAWLESDLPSQPMPLGPGLFFSARGLVIGKQAQYPIDVGSLAIGRDGKIQSQLVDIMEIWAEPLQNMRGNSDKAKRIRKAFLEVLELQLFGVYGATDTGNFYHYKELERIQNSPSLEAFLYPRRKYQATDTLLYSKNLLPHVNPLHDLQKIAKVVARDENTVTIKVRLSENSKRPLTQNEEVIKQMFFITHWQLVQRAYRQARLIGNDLTSAIKLLDDFIESMQSSQDQDLYLMYSHDAWKAIQFRMNLAHQYVSINDITAGFQPFQYQTIADVFTPFFPLFGIIAEKHPSGEYEIKRLFHNDETDPLHLLPKLKISENQIMRFYHTVGSQMPSEGDLIAISHTPAHTRLYRKIGFLDVAAKGYSEKWSTSYEVLKQRIDNFQKQTQTEN